MIENILLFHPNKVKNGHNICFTISKNIKNYISIKFYIPQILLTDKLSVLDGSKLKFGCDKGNFNKWYLIIGKHGYSMKNDGKGNYIAIINCPFNFIKKKMQCIGNDYLRILTSENAIELDVSNIFQAEKLILRKS